MVEGRSKRGLRHCPLARDSPAVAGRRLVACREWRELWGCLVMQPARPPSSEWGKSNAEREPRHLDRVSATHGNRHGACTRLESCLLYLPTCTRLTVIGNRRVDITDNPLSHFPSQAKMKGIQISEYVKVRIVFPQNSSDTT